MQILRGLQNQEMTILMPYRNIRIYNHNNKVFLNVLTSPASYRVYPPSLGFKKILGKKQFVEVDLLSKWFHVWVQKRHLLYGACRHSPHQKLQVCNILIDTLQLDATFEKKNKKPHVGQSHGIWGCVKIPTSMWGWWKQEDCCAKFWQL